MLRRFLWILGLLCLLLGFWPAAGSLYELTGETQPAGQLRGVVHWLHAAIRPQPRLAATADIAPTAASILGVNTFLEQEVLPEVRAQSLQYGHDAGFRYIRQEFPWEDIEIAGKGDFVDRRNDVDGDGIIDEVDAWAKYDQIVQLAAENDIEIIARLSNPPAWTRALTDTIGTQAPPDNFDDYGDFVAAVVSRYRGQVTYFQLWNEPNIYPEWGERAVDPEAYTELLCTGYERARAANPDAVILAGALSPTIEMSGRNLNNLVFLERMYAAGAGDCFDILSAQGYGLFSGPTDQRLRPTVINYPHHLYLRDIMVRHGDAAKPIWISEMAWNVAPEPIFAQYGRVSEAEQAQFAVEAYERAATEWPWIGVMNYWFLKRPGDSERGDAWYYFRLLEPDFTPLPVYFALRDYQPPPAPPPPPAWRDAWRTARPPLALAGIGLLFWLLLTGLAPPPRPEADA